MAIPIHWIHVYQRPKQGNIFVKRYPVYNYQHTITNQGWFDTASCDIAVRNQGEGFGILNDYLCSYVAIYVDNPRVPIWEGLISRIIFNAGGASYTISLDDLANRVSVVSTAGSNVAQQTTIANDTGSQAIYGIKQDQIEGGIDAGSGATQRNLLRDTILAQRAYPQSSITQGQGDANTVHFELIGIFHTLEWEKLFTATSAGSSAFNTAITNQLAALANGATFFNNADTTQVTANAGTVPTQQRGVSVWDYFQKIAEAGDATNYWITGILPTDPNIGTRRLYYRQFNSTINYIAYQRDGLKPRNLYGRVIPPYLVTPDQGIRVNDLAIGFNTSGTFDPRTAYIQSVQYDANRQSVQWFSADNTTARAAFALNRGFKPLSKNMPGNAPLRVISS